MILFNLCQSGSKFWKRALLFIVFIYLQGCAALNLPEMSLERFADGLAALSGRGGEIARKDGMPDAVTLANRLSARNPATAWESLISDDNIDFTQNIGQDRILVGIAKVGAFLAIPNFTRLALYNSNDGSLLWEVDRPALVNGKYQLLAADPVILLSASNYRKNLLIAYDLVSGAQLWVSEQNKSSVTGTIGSQIVSFNEDGSLTLRNINDGKILWQINNKNYSDFQMQIHGGKIYLFGKSIAQLDPRTGELTWDQQAPEAISGTTFLSRQERLLIWGDKNLLLIDVNNGDITWQIKLNNSIETVTASNDNILLQLASVTPDKTTLVAFSTSNGKKLWQQSLTGQLAAPIQMDEQNIELSLAARYLYLNSQSGEIKYQQAYPKTFISGSPTLDKKWGQPDKIHHYQDNTFISREGTGLVAINPDSQKLLWFQPYYLNRSTLKARAESLKISYQLLPELPPGFKVTSPYQYQSILSSQSQNNYFRQQLARNQRIISSPGSSSSQKLTASKNNLFVTKSRIAQERLELSIRGLEVAGSLLANSLALSAQLKSAAIQALIDRKHIELDNAYTLHQKSFQDRYAFSPYWDSGHGVSIVDLNDGSRTELIYGPYINDLALNGMELNHFVLSTDQRSIITTGVGLDSSRYQPYVRWKIKLPRPSLLAYDLSALPFVPVGQSTSAVKSQINRSRLHELLTQKKNDAILLLINNGVGIDARNPYTGDTPLMMAAAYGNMPMVKILLERSADIYGLNDLGQDALTYCTLDEICQLLRDAGLRN